MPRAKKKLPGRPSKASREVGREVDSCGDKISARSQAARDKLRAAIVRHVEAQIADSWKGGGDPADYPVIEPEATLAAALLERTILEVLP